MATDIEKTERTPQRIIGDDAYTQLVFEGYAVVKADELSRLREVERRAKEALEPFARAAGYLTDANGWCDTDGMELCYDDGRRLSVIPLSAFRAAARTLSEREGQDG